MLFQFVCTIVLLCVFCVVQNKPCTGCLGPWKNANQSWTCLSSQRFCKCKECMGSWISKRAFYDHQIKLTNSFKCACIPKFDWNTEIFEDEKYTQPLFQGSETSVLEAITRHMYIFSMNYGMSKTALNDSLQCEKASLPQPNILPASYKEAKSFISPLLMPVEKYDACINDCIVYRDTDQFQYYNLNECPVCNEPRKTRKIYTYMPLGPRLARWYGTFNLCKLLYANKIDVSEKGVLDDFTDGKLFHSWFEPGQVFGGKDRELCVPLSLFTDGVNPNRNIVCQKSMWPVILTWITLPQSVRQLLGPMLLMGIIPSGKKGSEPKSLDPYLSILVDELLSLTEFPVYDSYRSAPMNIKVALLQYLCDIPAYSKVMHLSGHGGLRSCPYCREVGHYCKHLCKTIHMSNRQFLPLDHDLRQCVGFANGEKEERRTPTPYTLEEEHAFRRQYEEKPNNSQRAKQQKQTGVKGKYVLQQLPYHNRMQQMSPDGMHTIADFISHVIDMLGGKQNTIKVKACENSFSRFEEVWPSEEVHEEGQPDEHSVQPKKKRKKDDNKEVSNLSTSSTPWSLSKEQLSIANERASSIVYTNLQEITPGPHFTKPWTLRTMNSKLQFVTSGAFEWCIKGLLPPQQETTLSKLCNVIKRITSPQLFIADLPSLQADTHEALALFERDFPLSMQNLTTHLIHHIVDDLSRYGPMHGRWLFPYERANAWITRQCLRKGMEESTVMETYVVYDWCVFMILSGRFDPSKLFNSDKTLVRVSQHIMDNIEEGLNITATANDKNNKMRASLLTQEMESYMMTFYVQNLKLSTIYGFSKTVAENHSTLDITDDGGRRLSYIGENYRGKKPPSLVKIPGNSELHYGQVSFFFKHFVCGKEEHWLVIDMYPIAERNEKYHVVQGKIIGKKLFHASVVSKPLVYVKDGDSLWILNA